MSLGTASSRARVTTTLRPFPPVASGGHPPGLTCAAATALGAPVLCPGSQLHHPPSWHPAMGGCRSRPAWGPSAVPWTSSGGAPGPPGSRHRQGVPPSPRLCPPRRQGTCPPPRSTPRTPERMFSPWPQPPQPLNPHRRMPRRGPATATPSLASCQPLPPPQTRPKTLGPRSCRGLRPPPARPPCAQVSLCPPPSGQAQRGRSGPGPSAGMSLQRCGRLPSGDPRVPSPPPARVFLLPRRLSRVQDPDPRFTHPLCYLHPRRRATGQGTRGWGSTGRRKPRFLPHSGAPGKRSPWRAGEPGRLGRAHVSGRTRTHTCASPCRLCMPGPAPGGGGQLGSPRP